MNATTEEILSQLAQISAGTLSDLATARQIFRAAHARRDRLWDQSSELDAAIGNAAEAFLGVTLITPALSASAADVPSASASPAPGR